VSDPAALAGLGEAIGSAVTSVRGLGGQHGVEHCRLTLDDGREAFAKHARGDPAGFTAEAASLRWLAEASAVGIPAVLAQAPEWLVIDWVSEDSPGRAAAERFGRELAGLHAAGADRFGAPWEGEIAGLPLPNDAAEADSWPGWYAAHRVLPYARIAADAGTLSKDDTDLLEAACARFGEVAGPAEPPARLHGDLWSGNVLWSGGRGWLIDPAAHGGHRETDLAMLALFGAPHLGEIVAGYESVHPLRAGWRERIPVHQRHPLAVHAASYGRGYGIELAAAAR
jgi:fructosamine-3-kinase